MIIDETSIWRHSSKRRWKPARTGAAPAIAYALRQRSAGPSVDQADAVTTTLLYSVHQGRDHRRCRGESRSRYNVPFLYKDFREGWKEGQAGARSLGIYRQTYCGCIFSEYERFATPSAKKRRGR